MEVMLLVLPLALLVAGGFLVACVRAIRAGQFDDLETPAHRAVWDDDQVREEGPLVGHNDAREPGAAGAGGSGLAAP